MGLSTNKTKTTTNQTSNVNSTTTPQTPGWISDPWQQYMSNAGNLAGQVASNPYQFAAPANDLQDAAYESASNLGGWQPANALGQALSLNNALQGPNLVGAPQTYQAAQIGGVNLGPAPQGTATSFTAPQIGQMQGYTPGQVDIGSILSGLGAAPGVTAGSATAGVVGPAALAQAQNAQSVDASALTERFRNAGLGAMVSSIQDDARAQADRVRTNQAAQAAAAGAFGSSRYGIREAQTEGELARAENAAVSQARYNEIMAAMGFAGQQAALDTGVNVGNADRFSNVSMHNSGQQNENARTQAGLTTQAGIANANNATQASIAGAGIARDYGLAGLDARLRGGLANAQFSNDASRFLSEAANARTMQQGQNDFTAASQNTDAANRFGLANLDLAGQYGIRGAELGLQRGIAQAGLDTDAARFGADTINTTNRFNATQADAARQQQLAALGLMGQLGDSWGNNSRADAGTQLEIGNSMWNRDNYLAGLPLSLQAQIGGILNQPPLGAFVGQNTQGTETSNGTSTSVQNQGLGSLLGGILGAGLSGWAGGGFRL